MKTGVVGATGYTGSELVSLLNDHPSFDLELVTSRQHAGQPFASVYPRFQDVIDLTCREPDLDRIGECDLVFLAVPHGTSMELVPEIDRSTTKVVDLAGDYRLSDQDLFEETYGTDHADPENLSNAVYGLSEYNQDTIRGADLVANPGCYVTGFLLPMGPVLEEGLLESPLFVDAKSGISGAGRSPSDANTFMNVNDEVKPYKVGNHRHQAEMIFHVSGDPSVKFVPHVVSAERGIEVAIYGTPSSDGSASAVEDCLREVCKDHGMLRYRQDPVGIKAVANTPYCDISVKGDDEGVIIFSCLDNLLKGAASQAVQNANLMLDRPMNEGIV